MIFYTDNTVLSSQVSSFSNKSLIMLTAGSIGTEVNNGETLYEQRHSPGRRVTPLALFIKYLVLCIWWVDLPTSGFRTLLRMATPYVTEPQLERMGLRGDQFYGF